MSSLIEWLDPDQGPTRPMEHPCRAVVFIHGIFSGYTTFNDMHRMLADKSAFRENDVQFFYYDYQFWNSLENNGQEFATVLRATFSDRDHVTIVSHSMGGLVARLALLSNPLPFVRLLFLLGTPNAGAIRLSQLAILSQMMHAGFGGLFAVFPRASGIYELSRASRILEKYSANAANTSDVDYISIPGLLFHEDQALFEDVRSSGSKFFASLDAATRIMSALHPLLALQLGRPHDGIVEESSNNMITGPSGRWHEKKGSIGNQRGNHAATYAHAVLPACGKLNHIEIHSDLNVIDVIGRLILSSYATNQSNGMRPAPADADKSLPAGRLGEWVRSFTQKDRDTIDVSFGR